MNDRFGLQIQAQATAAAKVAVVADVVARRNENRFRPADVTEAFYNLNIEPPGNVPAVLGALRSRDQAVRHPNGDWSLTPVGRKYVADLGIESADEVTALAEEAPAAEFAHVDHTVIPSWMAPPRWSAGIARLQERHPFDSNVLGMTRFPSEGDISDPVHRSVETSRAVLNSFGLTLHLASDAIVDEDLFGNVGAYMWACRYGLGFVEDRVGKGVNYNAVIELGGMVITGRRCAILKDHTAPKTLPTDLAGQIYNSVDFDDQSNVADAVERWASADLGLRSVR